MDSPSVWHFTDTATPTLVKSFESCVHNGWTPDIWLKLLVLTPIFWISTGSATSWTSVQAKHRIDPKAIVQDTSQRRWQKSTRHGPRIRDKTLEILQLTCPNQNSKPMQGAASKKVAMGWSSFHWYREHCQLRLGYCTGIHHRRFLPFHVGWDNAFKRLWFAFSSRSKVFCSLISSVCSATAIWLCKHWGFLCRTFNLPRNLSGRKIIQFCCFPLCSCVKKWNLSVEVRRKRSARCWFVVPSGRVSWMFAANSGEFDIKENVCSRGSAATSRLLMFLLLSHDWSLRLPSLRSFLFCIFWNLHQLRQSSRPLELSDQMLGKNCFIRWRTATDPDKDIKFTMFPRSRRRSSAVISSVTDRKWDALLSHGTWLPGNNSFNFWKFQQGKQTPGRQNFRPCKLFDAAAPHPPRPRK